MERPGRFVALLLLLLSLIAAAQPNDNGGGNGLEELRRCNEDALPDSALAWADRGKAETLGFVTPWNGKGYEVAEKYAGSLTYVSPVLYQIRAEDGSSSAYNGNLVLTGGHDHDGDWVARVRAAGASCSAAGEGAGAGVKIVPRVLWEVARMIFMQDVLKVVLLLKREIKARAYDGVVLEFPIDSNGVVLGSLVASLRTALPEASIIVAIPAFQNPLFGQQAPATPATLAALEKQGTDRFLAMCYDFVTQGGRTNSPIGYVKATVEALAGGEAAVRRKMLVSLPWYGYDNGQPVLGHDVAQRLLGDEMVGETEGSAVAMVWDAEAQESVFEYTLGGERHAGTYPTPAFFRRRQQFVKDEGLAGIGIWELGQGLRCFPRLL